MKIKLSQKIQELGGKEVDLTIGKAMANITLMDKGDPLRAYIMAQKLYSEDEIDLSKADFEWIKTTVKEHGNTFYPGALVSGQILSYFSELKED